MYRYHYRLRVILLSLGVVLGYGSAIAHYAFHRHHPGAYGVHGCAEDHGWFGRAPWAPAQDAARSGQAAPKAVQ
jgi:hypothetical protein